MLVEIDGWDMRDGCAGTGGPVGVHMGIAEWRIGLDCAVWAQTVEWTSCSMGVIQDATSQGNVFWGNGYEDGSVPRMEDRIWVRAYEQL